MDSLIVPAEVAAALLCIAVLGALGLVARRSLLSRRSGAFDCAVRTRSRAWSMGVARYETRELQWFAFFSLRTGPSRRWQRQELKVRAVTRPVPAGRVAARAPLVVIQVEHVDQQVQFAVSPDIATGFSSWVESAPPGMVTW